MPRSSARGIPPGGLLTAYPGRDRRCGQGAPDRCTPAMSKNVGEGADFWPRSRVERRIRRWV
ncbi:MAG: hypothetical protein IPJ15_07660 [Actinomycetales bacterium]|nr:hypothetical protein [Candidatus Phosphoribacter baldrii]HRC11803.1 hypothetical protein [Dermatophilaceae bacterium]